MNKFKIQIAGWYLLSILLAFIFVVLAQWSVLGYPVFYNSLLYVALFFLHGYVFGLKKGVIGVTVILLIIVIMLVSDNYYQMIHFFQNGLMVSACIAGGFLKLKKYYLLFASLAIVFVLFGFAHYYHSTPRYLTNGITIEVINSTNSNLIGHHGKQLTLNSDTVYLVNFSFRSCVPCRRKKNTLKKIGTDFKNTPFKVIEIHAFESKQIFDTDYFFDYAEAYHDSENKLSQELEVFSAPAEFIFDKSGHCVRRYDGFEQDTKANYEETTYLLLKKLIYEN